MATETAAPATTVSEHDALTEEEFYSAAFTRAYGDKGYELVDGQLVREGCSLQHEDICMFLKVLLRVFCDERGAGTVVGSNYAMRLDPRWSPLPDLMVIRPETRPRAGRKRLEGPADLVIEIASDEAGDPSPAARSINPGFDLEEKFPRYREEKVPELWALDPFVQAVRVEVWEPGGYSTRIVTAGRLAATVVPGFWIDVSWLWQEPLPSTMACLRQILAT